MAQLSLYMDDRSARNLHSRARKEKVSVSNWVSSRIHKMLSNDWPDGYFTLFGSLADKSFSRPAPPDADLDRQRPVL